MYKAENPYKQNRTILQKQGRKQSAQIADNRRSAFQDVIRSTAIQRKVFINNTEQCIKDNDNNDVPGFYAPQTDSEYVAMTDPFNRFYKNESEFHDHIEGKSVDCGLIKDKNIWFRLPFSEGFFVLGEKHSDISYKTIVNESNHQLSKILGEAGVVPIDYYSSSKTLLKNEAEDNNIYMMESTLSKLLFALSFAINKKCTNNISKILKSNNTNLGIATNEKEYNIHQKVADYIKIAINEIGNYIFKEGVFKDGFYSDCFSLASLLSFLHSDSNIKRYSDAKALCIKCVEEEIKRARFEYQYEFSKDSNRLLDYENNKRETYMIKAICLAKNENFAMAGIGDAHAKSIKYSDPIKNNNINVITFDEFKKTFSVSAETRTDADIARPSGKTNEQ